MKFVIIRPYCLTNWDICACQEYTKGFALILKFFRRSFVDGAKVSSQYLKWFSNYKKICFVFSKVTDTRNLAMLKSVKFLNFADFTQLAIKNFPQNILRWGFHTIFRIDLGFQSHQIWLYTNLFRFHEILARTSRT